MICAALCDEFFTATQRRKIAYHARTFGGVQDGEDFIQELHLLVLVEWNRRGRPSWRENTPLSMKPLIAKAKTLWIEKQTGATKSRGGDHLKAPDYWKMIENTAYRNFDELTQYAIPGNPNDRAAIAGFRLRLTATGAEVRLTNAELAEATRRSRASLDASRSRKEKLTLVAFDGEVFSSYLDVSRKRGVTPQLARAKGKRVQFCWVDSP